jgi:hypothetical protein
MVRPLDLVNLAAGCCHFENSLPKPGWADAVRAAVGAAWSLSPKWPTVSRIQAALPGYVPVLLRGAIEVEKGSVASQLTAGIRPSQKRRNRHWRGFEPKSDVAQIYAALLWSWGGPADEASEVSLGDAAANPLGMQVKGLSGLEVVVLAPAARLLPIGKRRISQHLPSASLSARLGASVRCGP